MDFFRIVLLRLKLRGRPRQDGDLRDGTDFGCVRACDGASLELRKSYLNVLRMCVCTSMLVYPIYIQRYTYIFTHTHKYVYIYVYIIYIYIYIYMYIYLCFYLCPRMLHELNACAVLVQNLPHNLALQPATYEGCDDHLCRVALHNTDISLEDHALSSDRKKIRHSDILPSCDSVNIHGVAQCLSEDQYTVRLVADRSVFSRTQELTRTDE